MIILVNIFQDLDCALNILLLDHQRQSVYKFSVSQIQPCFLFKNVEQCILQGQVSLNQMNMKWSFKPKFHFMEYLRRVSVTILLIRYRLLNYGYHP